MGRCRQFTPANTVGTNEAWCLAERNTDVGLLIEVGGGLTSTRDRLQSTAAQAPASQQR
jgi:hypothetical protein